MVEDQQFKINFLFPGLAYEVGIQNSSTLFFEVGTIFGLGLDSENDIDVGLFPLLGAEYRYYYNFNRRLSKAKNISANSGNYVALATQYMHGNNLVSEFDLDWQDNFFIGPVYGLQRTSKKGFNFEIAFGAGYFQNNNESGITFGADFSIGWVLGKNKNR